MDQSQLILCGVICSTLHQHNLRVDSIRTNADSILLGETIETHQTRDGDGRPVGSAHKEPPQDDLVEGSIATAGQEPVELQDHRKMAQMMLLLIRLLSDFNKIQNYCQEPR